MLLLLKKVPSSRSRQALDLTVLSETALRIENRVRSFQFCRFAVVFSRQPLSFIEFFLLLIK